MEGLVILFFIGATVSALVVGAVLARTAIRTVQLFGGGLVAIGIAFAIWTIAVIVKPDDPGPFVTPGVILMLVGFLLFVLSATQQLAASLRPWILAAAAAYAIVLIVLRIAYPSEPGFSPAGLFFFNPHGSVAALEILALCASALPAIAATARHLREPTAMIARVAFVAIVIGSVPLISSDDEVLLTLDGWVMGAAFVALLWAFVFRRPEAWLASGS